MNTDIANDFTELKRPKSLLRAALRFLFFVLAALTLLFVAPNSWVEWQAGLMTGILAAILWAISWRWKSAENRVIVWLLIYLGGMALWGILYSDIPSIGALACMFVGFELVLLIFHSRLRVWGAAICKKNATTEQAVVPNSSQQSPQDTRSSVSGSED